MDSLDDDLIPQNNYGPEFQNETLQFLDEIRKWARFLSILGFVGIGFMIIVGTAMGSIDTSEYGLPIPGGLLGIIYTIVAAIYFFPVLFLYRFSQRMKNALTDNDPEELKLAFMNLRSHYKFIGILAIIMIVMYLLVLVSGAGAALLAGI